MSKSTLATNKIVSKGNVEESDSSDEQIFIKNLETGESENSKNLVKHHKSLLINEDQNQQIWKNYHTSIKKMQDKLLELVIRKNSSQLMKVLTEYPIDLSQMKYMDGWGLLHFAIGQSDFKTAETLLQFGIDIDMTTAGMLRTALHQASLGNKPSLVKLLIEWGADPNIPDYDRNTAIHFAVDYGYLDIVQLILKSRKPVDLNLRNCMNMTTFNTCRNPDIFELLFNYDQKIQKGSQTQNQTRANSSFTNAGNNYESRLVIRNSDVLPSTTRADMVERFLSLRENTVQKKYSHDLGSVISEESFNESIEDEDRLQKSASKRKKGIGSCLRNTGILKGKKIASQNIGLVKQSIFATYLQGRQSIDNFDILRNLGAGSFAEVFLVRRKQSSSLYALKKVDKKLLIENNLRQYILAQKDLLSKVKHPFVIEAHSFFQDFTHLYMLLQFCQQGDLQKIVRHKGLSEDIAKTYVCECALALSQIHKNGFLYRDLKVSNILIDRDGHLRVADFGLAKLADSSQSFLGSVSYLAPQMLVQGVKKPHTYALDWYLLGIFIYELFHCHPPFYSEDRQVMENAIKFKQPTFDCNISPNVKEVILKLLQKNPEKRLKSLTELKENQWFKDIDWSSILLKKGVVLQLPKKDMKQLRKKIYFQSFEDKIIDSKIEWFHEWNSISLQLQK